MSLAGSAREAVAATAARAAGAGRALTRTTTHSSFPTVDGVLAVRGADHVVEVIRDRHGVPHVFAATEADAFFGHGFVHAQDRLFQMEGARRLASGRLAEVAGAGSLGSDRLMRRVGLHRAAARDAANVRADVGDLLEAYARGVNQGVRRLKVLPPEFALLGDDFAPWRVEDVMLLARYVMFGFAGNWNTELVRERLAAGLGAELASALDPVHPPTSTVTGQRYSGAEARLLRAYEETIAAGLPRGLASNAWAVASARSETGAPLLANDPHVEMSLPGVFHVAHISGGDYDLAGAGIAGVPGALIGHNQHVAWGVTAGMTDVADCYIEEFEANGSTRYRTPAGWAQAEVILERIEVQGAPAVEERVLVTRHGPVVSPAFPGEQRAIALRTTVTEGIDLATPFTSLWTATGLDEAEQALGHWSGTTFNFILASREDRIAYRLAGGVPRRRPGQGLLPQDGATSEGTPPVLGASALPRIVDPASGVLVSANNAVGTDLELGEEWADPARAERIRERLDAVERHSVASFSAVQGDRYSALLVRLRDAILQRDAVDGVERVLLEGWDGVLDAQSAGGALVHATYRALATDLAERVAGALAHVVLGSAVGGIPVNSAFAYRNQGAIVTATERVLSPWYRSAEDRDRRLRGAVGRAAALLRQHSNEDPLRWRLGDVQRLRLPHLLDAVPGFGHLYSRGDWPFGGDVNTVVQAQGVTWTETNVVRIAPGYRQVLDLADWDRSVFMIPAGNSGIPGHPRYDDCIEEFVGGFYRPLLFSREAVESAAESWLVLERADAPDTSGASDTGDTGDAGDADGEGVP